MPLPEQEVPDYLDWNLWIGAAPKTPYNKIYHPGHWRAFWNYGTGKIGDWFCHIADGAVWILDLYEPTVVECVERETTFEETSPAYAMVRWDFPKRGEKDPCTLYWHDGIKQGGTT